jgi:hypothetical protein
LRKDAESEEACQRFSEGNYRMRSGASREGDRARSKAHR